MYYYTTALEDWVTKMYTKNRIMTPNDIKVRRIARLFGIFVKQKPMPARFDIFGRYKGIVLDSRESIEVQREQFFHELCHILRHAGHQTLMPKAFLELQERDAKHFTLYALMPYHMIKNYDFEDDFIIDTLAEDFKVRRELVIERLDRIKQRQEVLLVAENKINYA